MAFKKGNIPWNEGLTKETNKKIKQSGIKGSKTLKLKGIKPPSRKGCKHSEETILQFKGRVPWNKGLTSKTDERLRKMGYNQRIPIDLDLLRNLYLNEKLSCAKVAKKMNIGADIVLARVRELGIVRSISDALKGNKPSDIAREHNSDSLKLAYKTGRKIAWNKKPKVKLFCKNCGEEFSVPSYRPQAQFCSKKCYGEWKTKHNDTRIKLICKNCGEEFFVSPCEKDKRITCSHKCSKKLQWQEAEFVAKQMKARNVCPNKVEMKLEKFLSKFLPNEYKYVGDGQFILAGKCPDFLNVNGQKKIVELYGDYWHKNDNPQDRIDLFAEYGYQTLVIWEKELKDENLLREKLLDFS